MKFFNYGEFAVIESQAGLNSYKISVKECVEKPNVIGMKATTGRYEGDIRPQGFITVILAGGKSGVGDFTIKK
jgi:hypothetical protein